MTTTTAMYGRDPLEALWKEILDLHWNYLEMEESLKKIDERKKLEGRLREYISIVPHDRKFFLPETEHVLRVSITHMRDFSAFKGSIGFESISQYANNLFTKPWRKEYRVIKMYSGFYQHEIKNNLLDAEKIFIAMGYKLMPNQTLVLEGPICPDQVTNVSRDALTAYVECQIMKQVNSELTSIGLATTWNEIFNFRECHIGDSSQTIKGLTQMLQSHHMHMHSAMRKDPYALALTSPPMHHHYQQQQQAQLCSTHCSIHPYNQSTLPPPPQPASTVQQQPNSYYHHYNQPPPPPPCSLHYVPPQNCYQQQHHLPHSKSLDQYDGTKIQQGNGGINHHHRLSLDHNYKQQQQQQQQQQQFDYIDVAFNHPYNQPNSRAPLPYTLSSNLGHDAGYYPTTAPNDPQVPRMFSTNEFYQQQLMQQQLPTTVSDYHHHQQQQHHPKSCTFSDASSPAVHDELISFSNEPVRMKPTVEAKLRSSLKKGTQSTASESVDMEHELNELRALKREKSLTPASTSSDVKTRDGIGNYQAWDYVFQNLEKDLEKKKSKVVTADEKIAAELESLKVTANGHGPPRDRSLSHKSNSHQKASGHHTKARTKSVSGGEVHHASNHEHKRTSSVLEGNQRVQMPKAPELVVGPNEWSCRFCTFLNPNTKKICEMCSKSKDFFHDADKSPAATCV